MRHETYVMAGDLKHTVSQDERQILSWPGHCDFLYHQKRVKCAAKRH